MKTTLTAEQKEANKLARKEAKERAKEAARIESEKNQPSVRSILITIEWKKSRTWGSNPHAKAEVTYKSNTAGEWETGFYRKDGYTCSGCGYDKESTVIADIFNEFMKYKLWQVTGGAKDSFPYGAYICPNHVSYSGGIGTSCYYNIAEAIGGKFEHIASGKTFDVYKYTDNN